MNGREKTYGGHGATSRAKRANPSMTYDLKMQVGGLGGKVSKNLKTVGPETGKLNWYVL
jgi:hypothetical protein